MAIFENQYVQCPKSVGSHEENNIPAHWNYPCAIHINSAPKRPNGIGISAVKLLSVDGHTLNIENVDILDGTPLLDIKPYVPQFHNAHHVKVGWLTGKDNRIKTKKADDRFD